MKSSTKVCTGANPCVHKHAPARLSDATMRSALIVSTLAPATSAAACWAACATRATGGRRTRRARSVQADTTAAATHTDDVSGTLALGRGLLESAGLPVHAGLPRGSRELLGVPGQHLLRDQLRRACVVSGQRHYAGAGHAHERHRVRVSRGILPRRTRRTGRVPRVRVRQLLLRRQAAGVPGELLRPAGCR